MKRNNFGTVIVLPSGKVCARWWEGLTRKKKTCSSKRDANDYLARMRIALGDGTMVDRRKGTMGFDELAGKWMELHSRPKLRSHKDNDERFRKHLQPYFKNGPIKAITPTRVLELRAHLQAKMISRPRRDAKGVVHTSLKPMSPSTVNRVLALLQTILNFGVTHDYLASSPITRLGRGGLKLEIEKVQIDPPIADPKTVGALLAAIRDIGHERRKPGFYPFFSVLVFTGLRKGEALGLRWKDVNLDRRTITIRRSYEGPTKSGKHRTLKISQALAATLRAWRAADPWQSEFVFPDRNGEIHRPDADVEQVLFKALKRIGHPRIRLHDLRHVYASHYMINNGSLFKLQKNLGHSTPQITSDTYVHLAPGEDTDEETDRVQFPEPSTAGATVVPMVQRQAQRQILQTGTQMVPQSAEIEGDETLAKKGNAQ